jgi:outer membrane protein OmpA-like peptidoglycan-associated protein
MSKNKHFVLFLFVVILIFRTELAFAQDFDSPVSRNNSLAPTSTIIKGKLFAYHYKQTENKKTTPQKEKLEANLTVKNLRTHEQQTRVFSPDTVTGSYFMFLLPDERYEISIQVEGFRPYVIVVFIPPQTFIYELNRDIIFEPITLLGEQIGQHNFFEARSQNLTNYYDSTAFHNYDRDRFEVLKELIDYTMAKGNIDAFDSLERITVNETSPKIPIQYISSQLEPTNNFIPIFDKIKESFSHGSWEYIDEFYARQSTGNTYYSKAKSISTPEKEDQKTIVTHFVLFDGKNAKRLTREQKGKLKEVAHFLNNDPRLAIEIFGRTYSEDNENQGNLKNSLHRSAKRTKQVFNYLKRRVDDKSKFHYIVYGMSEKLDDAIIEETIQEEKQNNTDKEELILTQIPPKAPRVELVISLE